MVDHILYGDSVEVINLASRQNGREHLVLLCRGQNEHDIRRWLFKCLQKCIESRVGEHVHLVDYKHAVIGIDRRHLHLVDDIFHIVDTVVGCGVEFYDVKRRALVEFAA